MAKFRLRKDAGMHQDVKTGRLFKAGDVVESDKPLDRMFREKFEKVGAGARVAEGTPLHDPSMLFGEEEEFRGMLKRQSEIEAEEEGASFDEEGDPNAGDDESDDLESELGEDVSSKFAKAKDLDLAVFHKGRKYFVTDRDTPNEAMNKEDLTSQKAVEEYLADQSNGE